MELTTKLVRKLQAFQFKKTCKLDQAKFVDLYITWMEVYNHLKALDQEFAFDHGPMLDMVARKLPVNMLREWVKARAVARVAGKSYLEFMQEFMRDERDK